jgi:hypothetical protein
LGNVGYESHCDGGRARVGENDGVLVDSPETEVLERCWSEGDATVVDVYEDPCCQESHD